MKKKLTALGCYIFAGGFTLGMQKYFKILGHFEEGDFGVDTAKYNLGVRIWTEPDTWPIAKLKPNVIYCNPPCAAWSAAGRSVYNGKDNWKTDERVDCTRRAFSLIEKMKPDIWVWESVCRAYTSGRPFVDKLTYKAKKMGYSITYFFTCASLHGAPQYRKRFHFIAHKVKLQFEKPSYKLQTVENILTKLGKQKFKGKISKHYMRIIKNTLPGRGLISGFNKLMVNKKLKKDKHGRVIGRPNFLKVRLHPKLAASTFTGGNNMVHPYENRWLTIKEAQVLTGFPKSYVFMGHPYQEIGKTVTPQMGEYLGKIFYKSLQKNIKIKPKVQIIDYRKMCDRRIRRKKLGLIGGKK